MNGHDIADFIDLGTPFDVVIGLAIEADCSRSRVGDAVQALPEYLSHAELLRLLEAATQIVADRPAHRALDFEAVKPLAPGVMS